MTTLKAGHLPKDPRPTIAELQEEIANLKSQVFELTGRNSREATMGRAEVIKAAAGADGVILFVYTATGNGPEVFAVSTMHITAALPVVDIGRKVLIGMAHNLASGEAIPA